MTSAAVSQSPSFLRSPFAHFKELNLHAATLDTLLSQDTTFFKKLGTWGWGLCYAVVVDSQHAYIGNGMMFQVLNALIPGTPVIVGELAVENEITCIFVRGTYAYVTNTSGFLIIDISNATFPRQVASLALSGLTMGVSVQGLVAYVGTYSGRLVSIDITDPSNPRVLGSISTGIERVNLIAPKDSLVYSLRV
ncbi:MAG: hypothetical protein HYR67_18115 [Bacteroidetes bacterium]|nr:hypothetical protein [Bacteroidota bacterium]